METELLSAAWTGLKKELEWRNQKQNFHPQLEPI